METIIDNKKMWESIYLAASADDSAFAVYILQGLQDQGYTIKSGEIVSIEPEQHFEVGDRVRRKGTNTKGDVITNIYESGGVTMYEFENSEDAPQSLSWEPVDNSQRMVSAEAKEALLNDGELSEFEKALAECINRSQCSIITPERLAVQCSDELLSSARRQFVEEAVKWLDLHAKYYIVTRRIHGDDVTYLHASFTEEFKKAMLE